MTEHVVAGHCPNPDHDTPLEMVAGDWTERDADETSGIPAMRVRTLTCPECSFTAEQGESL